MNESKDRVLKFDERELFMGGVLLKVLHDLQAINEWFEIVIKKLWEKDHED